MPSISLTVRSYCTAALVLICASASAQNSIERVNGSIGRYIFTDIYRKQDEVRYNGKKWKSVKFTLVGVAGQVEDTRRSHRYLVGWTS